MGNKAPSAEQAHSSSPLDISPLTVGLQTAVVHLNWGFKLQQAFSLVSLCLVCTFGAGSQHFYLRQVKFTFFLRGTKAKFAHHGTG